MTGSYVSTYQARFSRCAQVIRNNFDRKPVSGDSGTDNETTVLAMLVRMTDGHDVGGEGSPLKPTQKNAPCLLGFRELLRCLGRY